MTSETKVAPRAYTDPGAACLEFERDAARFAGDLFELEPQIADRAGQEPAPPRQHHLKEDQNAKQCPVHHDDGFDGHQDAPCSSRGVLAGVEIGAQIVARHAGRRLDLEHMFGREGFAGRKPFMDRRLADADQSRESRLRPLVPDGSCEWRVEVKFDAHIAWLLVYR